MPSREQLQRMLGGGSRQPAPAPRPAAPAAAPTLPALPDGYAWVPDPVHGVRAVQVAPPPPAPSRLVDPAGRPYAPGSPPAAPPGHTLLPYRPGSTQLLRPGVTKGGDSAGDTYQQFLDTLPDLDENQRLIPPSWAAAITSGAPEAAAPYLQPRTSNFSGKNKPNVSEDPHEDAWGGRPPMLVSIPLAKE